MDTEEKIKVIDKVIRHFKRQRVAGTNGEGDCVYRADNGNRCAVGCLIPKRMYDPEMDAGLVQVDHNGPVQRALRRLGYILCNSDVTFLRDLQRLHDENASDVVDMIMKYRHMRDELASQNKEG